MGLGAVLCEFSHGFLALLGTRGLRGWGWDGWMEKEVGGLGRRVRWGLGTWNRGVCRLCEDEKMERRGDSHSEGPKRSDEYPKHFPDSTFPPNFPNIKKEKRKP